MTSPLRETDVVEQPLPEPHLVGIEGRRRAGPARSARRRMAPRHGRASRRLACAAQPDRGGEHRADDGHRPPADREPPSPGGSNSRSRNRAIISHDIWRCRAHLKGTFASANVLRTAARSRAAVRAEKKPDGGEAHPGGRRRSDDARADRGLPERATAFASARSRDGQDMARVIEEHWSTWSSWI